MKKNDLKWINAFQEHSEHSSSHVKYLECKSEPIFIFQFRNLL